MSKHSAGGRARAEGLTPARRSEIAKQASQARWRPRTDDMARPQCRRCRKLIGAEDAACKPGKGWVCVACVFQMLDNEQRPTPELGQVMREARRQQHFVGAGR